MGLSYQLLLCLLLCGGAKQCCSQPLWLLPGGTPTPGKLTSSVEVECLEAELVVTVSRDLFGTGKLIQPEDLTLGSENCRPLVSVATDVVRFKAQLHECSNRVQVTEDALVYSTVLLHQPRPVPGLSILRTNRADVPIECRYPRQGNVSSHAIRPTWVPFSTTVSSEEKLVFSLRLMEENWNTEKLSPTSHLGEVAYLQAEVQTGSHLPLLLFVDRCVPTPSPDQTASPYHVIVDFHGCLVDGLSESFSAFQVPRPRPETLQFTVDVFHFANSSRNTIYITCHLKVTPANQTPDELNKACSFNRSSKSWSPVEGDAEVCGCCSSGDCGSSSRSRYQAHGVSQWPKSASRRRRHVRDEADVTVGPLIFLGKASDQAVEGWASSAQTSLALGLGLAAVAFLTLAAIVLGVTRSCHTPSHVVSLSQ
ncbi:zona pellucida sperm-binding protein 3 precursor [Mesocricetus auratus]|uniref:Zona pellucida sperm-binding protein 3 n=2 Tax=Mesocricetus auratus TaxID=10036 RepID=ZP3_MESAU|nr:zona pellucida sperm-binding protein 3 precursor [Mesocricetus auratus]P23491.2 RecName: Full=Zona pellucida sperm-binding protein 3; AltName: Full=Sperm receptor; AltName: Full=Zona pellucida glycoprotein 3; Short=Zp-3; AltName: Full=Zona pellucida protein C; Contains: RecName: Full=Processed zona pellucida sperm-binding protein 3; Flags: Precursor [Mesocricetus auratus]AAA37079.1 glycoprotein hZP3 [Mesocricetus auratus]